MNAEDRTKKAIEATRLILDHVLRSPDVLVQMAALDVTPEAVEDVVTAILEYRDKTEEKAET